MTTLSDGFQRHNAVTASAIECRFRSGSTAIEAWTRHTINADMDLMALLDKIEAQTEAVLTGDLGEMEAMLVGQALTLQSTFTALSRRAAANVNVNLRATESYLKLALRAQGQCRATIETLAEIKNPRSVAFIKLGNFAQNQQINHGSANGSRTHEKNAIAPNELLTDDGMNNAQWTPERRAQQARAIREWKPWTQATGPRTAMGKGKASRNAFKGGERPLLRALSRALAQNAAKASRY